MAIFLTCLCLYIIWQSGMYIYLKMQPEKFLAHEGLKYRTRKQSTATEKIDSPSIPWALLGMS